METPIIGFGITSVCIRYLLQIMYTSCSRLTVVTKLSNKYNCPSILYSMKSYLNKANFPECFTGFIIYVNYLQYSERLLTAGL